MLSCPTGLPVAVICLSLDQIHPGCISGFVFLCLEDFFFLLEKKY